MRNPACTGSSLLPSNRPKKYPRYRETGSRRNVFQPPRQAHPNISGKADPKSPAARFSRLCRNPCLHGEHRNSCTTPAEDPRSNMASIELRVFAHARALLQWRGQQSPSYIFRALVPEHSNTNGNKKRTYQENPASQPLEAVFSRGQLRTISTAGSGPVPFVFFKTEHPLPGVP